MKNGSFSILFPYYEDTEYKQLSDTAFHDLGLDNICIGLSSDMKERSLIKDVLSNMTADERVAEYRQKVFADILALPDLRKRLTELFEKVEFIRTFGMMHKETDEKPGIWHLLHRLDELDDYIKCVEEMKECLADERIKSEGLKNFREHIDMLYNDSCFAEMKKDIAELKIKASEVQSITLGINVNERLEAVSMGLISINSKPFKKSNIVKNFADAVAMKNKVQDDTEWDGDMHYQLVDKEHGNKLADTLNKAIGTSLLGSPFLDDRVRATIVNAPEGDGVNTASFYLEKILNKMLASTVKKLRSTLTKYANIAIMNISQIIPEFIYYIRFAEFIEGSMNEGFRFCEAHIIKEEGASMQAKAFYNLKLAANIENKDDIVCNDLDFDPDHTVYILTGANRGGKTTVTQAVGQLFVLAQGGIFVPADDFGYRPVDCVYTHFPADEDKTMDLGRLGEECVRFREIYSASTKNSLMLLNETFSTTSFEEGYYIAKDSVKALLNRGVRTIYNTHMHKLAADTDEMNEYGSGVKAASLIVRSENGKRSFKIEAAAPEGMSYAKDIAEKYSVTYEQLVGENQFIKS